MPTHYVLFIRIIAVLAVAAIYTALAQASDAASLVPLYRLNNSAITDHILTTSADEVINFGKFGYVSDGNAGYLYSSQISGTVPLYRLYNVVTTSHTYTTSTNDIQALAAFGFQRQSQPGFSNGVIGYVSPTQAFATKPLYRLGSTSGKDVIATNDPVELYLRVASGQWTNGGIAAYPVANYYTDKLPSGTFAGQSSKGIIMVIHGGGWGGGVPMVVSTQPRADRFSTWGYEVLNVDYRGAKKSFEDVLWMYDQIRGRFPTKQISVYGESAGGHLALMLAARRSGIKAVISAAGPTNLNSIGGNPFADLVHTAGVLSFGGSDPSNVVSILTAMSPVTISNASKITAKMLLGTASGDAVVPKSQQAEFCNARIDAACVILPNGTSADPLFVHAPVAKGATDMFYGAMCNVVGGGNICGKP